MTIDAPSVFCWSCSLAACWLALERDRVPAARLGWWLVTGLGIGLGFLCKYTNAMELVCVVWALAMVRRWRVEFRRPGFYAMLLVAAVVGSPPVFWNADHAWITLNHLHDRGRLGTAFEKPLVEFGKFFAAHLGVYSPLVLVGLLVAVGWGWRRAGLRFLFWRKPPGNVPRSPEPEAEKARFLLAFGLPLVVMYTLLAFKTAGEPNWTAPGFVSLTVLAAALWHERGPHEPPGRDLRRGGARRGPRRERRGARHGPVSRRRHPVGIPPRPERAAARLAHDGRRGRTIPRRRGTRTRRARLPHRQPLPARRRTRLLLPRQTPGGRRSPCRVHARIAGPRHAVFLWPRYDQVLVKDVPALPPGAKPPRNAEEEFRGIEPSPFVGRSALFITDDERHRDLPGTIEDGFEQCALVAQYEIRRRGQTLRTLRVYACFNYKGLEL